MNDIRVLNATIAAVLTAIIGIVPYCYRRNKLTRVFAFSNVFLAIWNLGDTVVLWPETHYGILFLFRLNYVAGVFVVWAYYRFMFTFSGIGVDESGTAWKLLRAYGVTLILLSLSPYLVRDIDDSVRPFKEIPGPLYPLFVIFLVWWLGYALYQFFRRFRISKGRERAQFRYMFAALFFVFLEALVFFVSVYIRDIPPFYFYLQVFYGLIVAYAILAHRLMDIAIIIRKTAVYSIVTGTLMLLYMGIVTLSAKIFGEFSGYQSVFSSAVAASLIALCFQPLRKRVQNFVDTKFFRQYVDREEKLYELSRDVITHTSPEEMAKALMRVLGDSLHPKCGALYLRSRDGSGFVRAMSVGETTAPDRLAEDNPLARYFVDHPQPFVRLDEEDSAESHSTRRPGDGTRAAA